MSSLFRDDRGAVVQIAIPRLDKIQNVSVSGSSAATTNAIVEGTSLAMLISTTACWFLPGTSPTAAKDATSIYLPANTYYYLPVDPSVQTKVAFIQDSASGTAQVIPCR